MTALDTVSETEIIQLLDFDPSVPCSVNGCTQDAAWYLICPFCRASEPVCADCREALNAWEPDEMIVFDGTCKHQPEIGECSWEPLA